MAVTEEDCIEMVRAIKEAGVLLAVCHVLRYTPETQKIKELVQSNVIGEVLNIQRTEPVGNWHFAHSFVRGNWHKESTSTFSLMAKCCHDIDWIHYIMGVPCTKISSFGNLTHFKKEKKPKDAGNAARCLECPLKDTCAYSAKRIYLDQVAMGRRGWPLDVLTPFPTVQSVTEALNTTPYGQCVYELDNDVADNQVVNMEFRGGKTANLTMVETIIFCLTSI